MSEGEPGEVGGKVRGASLEDEEGGEIFQEGRTVGRQSGEDWLGVLEGALTLKRLGQSLLKLFDRGVGCPRGDDLGEGVVTSS